MFYRPTSTWTWILVVIAFVETTMFLTIEGVLFWFIATSLVPDIEAIPLTRAFGTFMSLLIFGFVYQSLLLYDTLAQRNTIQLLGLCIYAVCLCIYAALQTHEIELAIETLEEINYITPGSDVWVSTRSLVLVNAVITGIYALAISLISFKLYAEFSWSIFRMLKGDIAMQRRYFAFKIFTTLLKFDTFFFLGFDVQFLTIISPAHRLPVSEYVVTLAAFPITAMTLMASTWPVRRESRLGLYLVLGLHSTLLGFFIFKYVRVYQPGWASEYLPARNLLTYFGSITIVMACATIAAALKCMANFDKGLKIHIVSHRLAQDLLDKQEMEISVLNQRSK